MTKEEIIEFIKSNTKNGKPLGQNAFHKKSGLRKSDWFPDYWLRWSDALNDAGFTPNKFQSATDINLLIQHYIDLIDEYGRFPIDGEIRLKRKTDKTFPSSDTFYSRLGTRIEVSKKIIECYEAKGGRNDLIDLCKNEIKKYESKVSNIDENTFVKTGFVYMLKHGSRNEYKIGKTFDAQRREGEIKLQLPEKTQPIHYIETDDPSGVETYWHNRFKDKSMNGEWFKLLADDVKAFKRWKRIV